jgi:hypothetical protein
MGFKPTRKRYHLKFADPEMNGLEVVAHAGSTGDVLAIMGLSDGDVHAGAESLKVFAKCLVSWNIEDEDGKPVPADLDGLKSLDLDFVMLLIQGWVQAVQDVPAPLEKPSNSGKPYPEASLPMEAL